MTHDVVVALAALGVAGQALVVVVLIAVAAHAAGAPSALRRIRSALWGYELWAVFLLTSVATGGSLFFSEVAHFVPCELCWYQRICMYPLSITTLIAAATNAHRAARVLLPLPVVGAGISIYHVLVENGVVGQTSACLVSAPGGCATKWIDEFGYMTIPTLALTAFALAAALLALAAVEPPATTVDEHGQR